MPGAISLVSPSQNLYAVRAHGPLPVGRVQPDGCIERRGKLDHRGVIVRVGDRNSGQAAECAHDLDRRVVDEADAVPQDISLRRAHQQRALGDGEGGEGANSEQSRFELRERVVVGPAHLLERGPGLAERVHVLPLLLADGATFRRFVTRRVLRAAGGADEGGHQCSFTAGAVRRDRPRESMPRTVRHQPCSACSCIVCNDLYMTRANTPSMKMARPSRKPMRLPTVL